VSPQYPYVEQHSPPEKPRQVSPTDGPHEASWETPVGVATALLALTVAVRLIDEDEARVDAQAGGVNAEEVAGLLLGVRYQFASGSPKHSPMVTPL
jgi:hypothetical protein